MLVLQELILADFIVVIPRKALIRKHHLRFVVKLTNRQELFNPGKGLVFLTRFIKIQIIAICLCGRLCDYLMTKPVLRVVSLGKFKQCKRSFCV